MTSPLRRLAALALALLAGSAVAAPEDGLLPVEQAFALSASAPTRDRVQLDWKIADNYYLYRARIKVKAGPGVTLGVLDLPAGEKKNDETFGEVEVYHHAVQASQAFTLDNPAAGTVELTVTVQGCHEVEPKICYPPHPTRLTLALPAASAAAPAATAAGSAASPLSAALGQIGGRIEAPSEGAAAPAAQGLPLPPEQAFRFEAIATSPTELLARWTMPKGYYLYRDKTQLTLGDAAGAHLGAPRWPAGVSHQDEHFGQVTVYFDQVELPLPLARSDGAASPLALTAEFQGCEDGGVCYPVMTRTVSVELPAATPQQVAASAANAATQPAMQATQEGRPESLAPAGVSLPLALLLALGGGLILNLMPCVLPILSLKAIAVLESGEGPQAARRHALYYTAGVMLSFGALGLLALALRGAGHAFGWGFQLQQPLVVAGLVYVMLAVGLSLSGVVQFGASLAGVGQSLTQRSGPAGDFFTGVLACVVASPCTAPFMGSALAFAFASPAPVALAVFLALGLGLALPFLLIGFVPAIGRWLPKPGAWMDTLKQVLAYPMYLTAVWLVWVLGHQRGIDAVGLVLAGAVALALALWWFERSRYRGLGWRLLALLPLLAALAALQGVGRIEKSGTTAAARSDGAVAFTRAKLASLRAEGKAVFVDMTADWCTTCKVNERAVLHTEAFRELLQRTGTVFMVGDWTDPNPEIEDLLREFRAVGVPLYVVFPRGGGPGRTLPTVLTQGSVREALEAASR